ncbi:MAG: hypothetical protein HOI66_11215, partial [Verrucomicrobia bacterium]|nr:hypothetical protein [Verrucomicrobiota bacterium]
MILISIRIARKSIGLHQHLQRMAPIRSPNFLKRIDETRVELGLKREIRIHQTNWVTSPAIFGLFSPRILLPIGFLKSYSDNELDHILKHELAHIKRQDTVWNLWSTLAQVIHWPNPIVWYATARMRGDRELATDYLALNGTSNINPQAYGETILKTLQMVPSHNPIPGLIGIAEERKGLIRRFEMIANFTTNKPYSKWLSALLVISLSVTCLTDSPLLNTGSTKEPTHTLYVSVTDSETGHPLENASVSYVIGQSTGFRDSELKTEKTDIFGSVRFQLSALRENDTFFMLHVVSQKGYISQNRHFYTKRDQGVQLPTRHDFKLRKGVEIGGTVVDRQNQPIENVALHLSGHVLFPKGNHLTDNQERLYVPFEAGVRTDKHGRWTCPGVPEAATQFQITLRKENGAKFHYSTSRFMYGRRSYSGGAPIVSTKLREKTSRLTFPDGSDINVIIKDEAGQPIAEAKVQELSGALSRQKGTILTTDQSGKVRFRERTVHEVAYIVSHSDYATAQELAVPMLGENSIEFVLKPKQRLKGSIVNQEGEAIEGAIIDLKTEANEKMFADWSTQSNRDGEFFWDNAPLMKTFYRIRADGYAPQVAEVTPASSPFEIVLDHPSKAIVEHTIQVLDAETNEPIPTFTYSKVTSWTYQYHTENQGTEGLIFMKAPTDQMTGGISHRETNQYYILARAPGYKSASSRPISIFESKAHSIIKLERAPQKHSFKNVVILAPNGETADRAVVTLVTDNFLSRPFAEYT